MKNFIILISLLASITVFAQDRGKIKARIKAQKTAFITNELDLTPKEAEKFWPIYNNFEKQIEIIRHNELKNIKQQIGQNSSISNNQANKLLQKVITAEDKMHNTKRQLLLDLKNVIPAIKILKLKRAEDSFNRKLLERLRDKHKVKP